MTVKLFQDISSQIKTGPFWQWTDQDFGKIESLETSIKIHVSSQIKTRNWGIRQSFWPLLAFRWFKTCMDKSRPIKTIVPSTMLSVKDRSMDQDMYGQIKTFDPPTILTVRSQSMDQDMHGHIKTCDPSTILTAKGQSMDQDMHGHIKTCDPSTMLTVRS